MKAYQYTLLDVQKSIVLAQRKSVDFPQPIRITNRMRSLLLQQVADLYATKHGSDSVCYSLASAVLRKGVARLATGCGITDTTYVSTLTGIFVDQLKIGVQNQTDTYNLWA